MRKVLKGVTLRQAQLDEVLGNNFFQKFSPVKASNRNMDTIAAISTPIGRGGVAIIRISGDDALEVGERMFRTKSGASVREIDGGRAVYGSIIKDGREIDDGIITVFRAPRSYTGEDTIEVSCHGGVLITAKVLEAALEAGARQAEAGEFTRRAFVNGKLTLQRAEAIGMLIDAETDEVLSLASRRQSELFRETTSALYEDVKEILTGIFAECDFPDEDLSGMSTDEIVSRLESVRDRLSELGGSYEAVRAVSEGIRTVLVGKPNSGKSSLLNRLCGSDRAIVTDIAGTTRDTVSATVKSGRVLLRLSDTAGIRETSDEVERLGIERAERELADAELVLAVFDLSRECDDDDLRLVSLLSGSKVVRIALLNKSDSDERFDISKISGSFDHCIRVSARTGDGLDSLHSLIGELFDSGKIDYDSRAVLLNARQNAAASRALASVRSALDAINSGLPLDTAGLDLEAALGALGELDARQVGEDVVNAVFSRFCVGK